MQYSINSIWLRMRKWSKFRVSILFAFVVLNKTIMSSFGSVTVRTSSIGAKSNKVILREIAQKLIFFSSFLFHFHFLSSESSVFFGRLVYSWRSGISTKDPRATGSAWCWATSYQEYADCKISGQIRLSYSTYAFSFSFPFRRVRTFPPTNSL